MDVEITEAATATLATYADVPIAYEVREILRVEAVQGGLGGLLLRPEPSAVPYWKDHDADPSSHPSRWATLFDTASWGVLAAWHEGKRIGGAAVAWNSPGVDMLQGRRDLALLWDVRVAPVWRGQGVGASLFRAAEAWARTRGAKRLEVETQNVNVPACRFYARQGCALGAIHRLAYPTLPDEVQLLWYKSL